MARTTGRGRRAVGGSERRGVAVSPRTDARRIGFLLGASHTLASRLDEAETLEAAARLAVPTIADFCFFDLLMPDGAIRRVARARGASGAELVRGLQRFVPPRDARAYPVARVLRSRAPVVVRRVTDQWLDAVALSPAHRRFMEGAGLRSLVAVPLVARDRTLGAMTCCYTDASGRRATKRDVALAEELARQAALAVDNARLYREARDAREAGEAQLRFALEAAALGDWELDLATHEAWASARHAEIFGYDPPPPSWTYERFLEHVLPDDRASVARRLDAALAAGVDWHVDCRIVRLDGEVRWIWARGRVLPSAEGKARRMRGLVADVTARHDAEEERARLHREWQERAEALVRLNQALQGANVARDQALEAVGAERRRLYELFEQIPAIVAVYRGPEHRVELANPLARRLLARRSVVGRTMREAVPELEAQGLFELWERAHATGEPLVGKEIRALLDREGTGELVEAYYDFVFQPLPSPSGEDSGLVVYAVDVTEQVQARQRVETLAGALDAALTESRAAVRARDEFLSVAAHELRTPITTVRGFAQLELRRLRRLAQPHARPDLNQADLVAALGRAARSLERIEEQTGRLSRLVHDLLDVARITRGRLELRPTTTDMAALVRRAVEAAQARTGRHRLALRAPARLVATADALRLEQVVANLLDNAIKYSPEGGAVEVELGPDAEHPGVVTLAVRDRGIGVRPDDRGRLFDQFYRASAPERPEVASDGLGLGLFISRQIVEAHGGRIAAEFPADGGTRLVVTLPMAAPAADGGRP